MENDTIRKVRNALLDYFYDYYYTVWYELIDEAIINSYRDNGNKPFEDLTELHKHIRANYI